jgi:hypothetical protein
MQASRARQLGEWENQLGIKRKAALWILNRIGYRRPLNLIREELSTRFQASLGDVVRYGPFKGSILSKAETHSPAVKAVKILGLYEQPVQRLIANRGPFHRGLFFGAADGYYAIGAAIAMLVQSSYCWDIDPRSHAALRATAEANKISDRVHIFGSVDEDTIPRDLGVSALSSDDLVLIDIEGGEFDLFSDRFLVTIGSAFVIVELHPWLKSDGVQRLDALIKKLGDRTGFGIIVDDGRSLTGIKEFSGLHDDERNLLCSEGRVIQMSWLYFGGRERAITAGASKRID